MLRIRARTFSLYYQSMLRLLLSQAASSRAIAISTASPISSYADWLLARASKKATSATESPIASTIFCFVAELLGNRDQFIDPLCRLDGAVGVVGEGCLDLFAEPGAPIGREHPQQQIYQIPIAGLGRGEGR